MKNTSNDSTDSFCYNMLLVLLELCRPFMKEDSKLLNKIDSSYLPSERRIGLNDATPL